jgi:hypothetical protein
MNRCYGDQGKCDTNREGKFLHNRLPRTGLGNSFATPWRSYLDENKHLPFGLEGP